MPWDEEDDPDGSLKAEIMRRCTGGPPRPRGEILDGLVELAAITLHDRCARFTAAELCAEARLFGGDDIEFDHDFAAAVARATCLESDGEGGYHLR